MEISGEQFLYDREATWLISSHTTDIQNGEPVTSAAMRQPLGAGPLSCAAFLPYPEHIVECAFEKNDDKLRVPRQIANVLNIPINLAISYFDEFLAPGWQDVGVTPCEIRELCVRQGRSFFYLSGRRMMESYEPPTKTRLKSIALTSWEGHAYLFSNSSTVGERSTL